jgi:hypothetical protein
MQIRSIPYTFFSVTCICILEVFFQSGIGYFFIKFLLIIKLKRIKILTLLKEQSCKINIAADIQALLFVYLNYKTLYGCLQD